VAVPPQPPIALYSKSAKSTGIDDEAEGAGVLHCEDKPGGFLLSSKETGVIAEFLNSAIVRWRGGIGVGLLTDGFSILAIGLRQTQRQGRTGWWGGWPEAHLIEAIEAVGNVHFATSELFQSLAVCKPYHQENEQAQAYPGSHEAKLRNPFGATSPLAPSGPLSGPNSPLSSL
jgi:hypothetical protein